ncbi:alpha/beta hydrolase [Knoellia locipacati]|uniref:Peptidase n=1 Tax=Knoellia locipacati TaxID=882824 RepID=A0A512T1C9_9MICO|nr:alpha/beta fold hydrolase [Knoellia locipacati]GEQ13964.1 peptidase [Knoellia locipacati]
MRKLVTTVAAVGLLGAGFASASGAQATPQTKPTGSHTSTPAYTPPPIPWGTCVRASLKAAGAQCGLLTVPLDYRKPSGMKIKIMVSRIKHKTSDAAAQGVMLANPGGPGASGLGLARLGGAVPNGGGDPYDWIGFDPRGVGESVPSLSCDPDYFAPGRPPYVPETREIMRAWREKARQYARDCAAAPGAILLDHTKTTDWAQDMDSIRKALGADKINYYGFSYGTYLGQVYATMFPERVRRFVFDGVVNPKDVWYEANLNQDVQFDRNIGTFFSWVAEHDAEYGLGTDGRALLRTYYRILNRLAEQPEGTFGAAEWNDIFTGAAYYVYDWDGTAHMFAAAVNGDFGPAKDYYGDPTGPGSDNTFANYNAVQCSDAQWPTKWRTWERDAWRIHAKHPFLAWNNTWYNAPCLDWDATPGKPVNVKGSKVGSILLIAETNDAATPFPGALEVRRRFPKSVLIEGVGGTTHSGSLSGVSCTDDRIANYLLTGALDPRKAGNRSDVQCEPVPPPDATPASATSATARRSSAAQPGMSADLRKELQAANSR